MVEMEMKPLAIVQARMGSKRLPGKMLLLLGERPLVWWAWDAAVTAFGEENVICAIPASEENDELAIALSQYGARVWRWDGPESDVLGRFFFCAHTYRWHPESVIVRVTADDPFKDPAKLRRVAAGERLPEATSGEAFTLRMLQVAHLSQTVEREHLTHILYPCAAPEAPAGTWTIDTDIDLAAARAIVAKIVNVWDE